MVTRRDGVEAELIRTRSSRPNFMVRLHSTHGFGRLARRVRVDVRRDDVLVEVVAEVEDVVRNAELGRDPARVLDVGDAATSGIALAAPQLEGHAGDVVALLGEQGGRDRGIDPAAHHDEHAPASVHADARSLATTSGTTASARSTSADVDAYPKLNRTDDSARSVAIPIASSTCEGSIDPELHAEPDAAYTSCWSSATSSVSASTPGNATCKTPGTRYARVTVDWRRPRSRGATRLRGRSRSAADPASSPALVARR